MTVKSLALAMVMAGSLIPGAAFAQAPQTNLVTPQINSPRPEGHATNTTDRAGLMHRPADTTIKKSTTPKNVPGWHIPLPHIHGGR